MKIIDVIKAQKTSTVFNENVNDVEFLFENPSPNATINTITP
jgi:hypothetical protein